MLELIEKINAKYGDEVRITLTLSTHEMPRYKLVIHHFNDCQRFQNAYRLDTSNIEEIKAKLLTLV